MVSLAQSAAKIASRTRIDSQFKEIQQYLESHFRYEARLPKDELHENWNEIYRTAREALAADLPVKSEKVDRAANLVREFVSEYEELISAPEASKNFESLAVKLDGIAKLFQGLNAICEGNTEINVLTGLQKLYRGLDLVAQAIQEYPFLLPDLTGQIFADLANAILAYTNQIAPADNGSEDSIQIATHKRMLSYCAISILWQVEQYQKQITARQQEEEALKNLYPDLETYEYMEGQGKIFDLHLPRLQEKYPNMYVRFENGVVLDWDEDKIKLANRSRKNCAGKLFFIEKVVAKKA